MRNSALGYKTLQRLSRRQRLSKSAFLFFLENFVIIRLSLWQYNKYIS